MYSVVWKYQVLKENQEDFEFEYGEVGSWNDLFRNSEDFTGSSLYKSSEIDLTYLLIDNWTDKQSYENFKEKNKSQYERLSLEFERLYKSEEKIGGFFSLE